MKITGIEIGEYRQFKSIKFDFTYPVGHPKAGQPLEKVCFIGQSGTGKTTLLNVIWDLIFTIDQVTTARGAMSHTTTFPDNYLPESILDIKYLVSVDGESIKFDRESGIEKSDMSFLNDWFLKEFTKTGQFRLIDVDKFCLFIKDTIAREADAFLIEQKSDLTVFEDFVKTDSQVEDDKVTRENLIKSVGKKRTVSLGDGRSLSIWKYLLSEINQYDETGKELAQSIVLKAGSISVDQMIDQLVHWKKNTANPRLDLAENCLNPLLRNFFLMMDTDSAEVPIVVRSMKGVKIESSYLSTGTRQLLSTAIPIYKFNTEDAVILFDEPERSLFPDIQRDLIKYYTSLAPEAQFFFATHSPIIASAFEPCERFILYFDENGEVKFHNGVAPEGDDPNDILRQDFDMAELMLEKGLKEYERYRHLAMQIRSETDEEKKNQLIVERLELGNRYNFAGQYAQNK